MRIRLLNTWVNRLLMSVLLLHEKILLSLSGHAEGRSHYFSLIQSLLDLDGLLSLTQQNSLRFHILIVAEFLVCILIKVVAHLVWLCNWIKWQNTLLIPNGSLWSSDSYFVGSARVPSSWRAIRIDLIRFQILRLIEEIVSCLIELLRLVELIL